MGRHWEALKSISGSLFFIVLEITDFIRMSQSITYIMFSIILHVLKRFPEPQAKFHIIWLILRGDNSMTYKEI